MNKGNRSQKVKIMCAWCDKEIGEKNGEGLEGVSHSICGECLDKLEAEVENETGTEDEQIDKRLL